MTSSRIIKPIKENNLEEDQVFTAVDSIATFINKFYDFGLTEDDLITLLAYKTKENRGTLRRILTTLDEIRLGIYARKIQRHLHDSDAGK